MGKVLLKIVFQKAATNPLIKETQVCLIVWH